MAEAVEYNSASLTSVLMYQILFFEGSKRYLVQIREVPLDILMPLLDGQSCFCNQTADTACQRSKNGLKAASPCMQGHYTRTTLVVPCTGSACSSYLIVTWLCPSIFSELDNLFNKRLTHCLSSSDVGKSPSARIRSQHLRGNFSDTEHMYTPNSCTG